MTTSPSEFQVEFSDLDEGYDGEYDEDDSFDVNLLRLDIFVRPTHQMAEEGYDEEEWAPMRSGSYCMRSGSYCTLVPDTTSQEEQDRLLVLAEQVLRRGEQAGASLKRTAEMLSWMKPGYTEKQLHKLVE